MCVCERTLKSTLQANFNMCLLSLSCGFIIIFNLFQAFSKLLLTEWTAASFMGPHKGQVSIFPIWLTFYFSSFPSTLLRESYPTEITQTFPSSTCTLTPYSNHTITSPWMVSPHSLGLQSSCSSFQTHFKYHILYNSIFDPFRMS